jgi:hypothetical protein
MEVRVSVAGERSLRVRKVSDIPVCDPLPKMTHEEYVDWDASRVFVRMMRQAKSQVVRPAMYVLNSPKDLERLPPSPGVYIAFDGGGRAQYVGESVCVGRRVGPFGSREFGYAKYLAYVPAESYRQQKALEFYYIGLLDPVWNKQLWPKPSGNPIPICHFDGIVWCEEKRVWAVVGSSALIRRDGKVLDVPIKKRRAT